MPATKQEMDQALYHAAMHLHEAGKALFTVEEFREDAGRLFSMAEEMATIIIPEKEKISEEKVQDVLDEILGLNQTEG